MEQKSDLQLLLERRSIKCLIAFALPMVLMAAAFAQAGVYASHGLTTLTSDLNGQYISYLAYLRNGILNGDLGFYTFTKTLGGDFFGFAAYYLFSPFNFILLLFPLEQITAAVYYIYLLKIGMAGLFFYLLVGKRHGFYYKNLIFSLAYCFMAYNVAYEMHLMWLDAMVFLPLVIIGIERIWEGKSSCFYAAMLTLTIVSCYYTGYMVCLFCGVYVFWKLIGEKEAIGKKCKDFVRFLLSSIVGVGMSAAVLIPALLSLSGSKDTAVERGFAISFHKNFNLLDLPSKLFTNCFDLGQLENGLPNLFCGIFILFLLFLYFFQGKVLVRQKIASFLVLLILMGSCYVTEFSMVWHGFAKPNGFGYRFSFVVSFFFIIVAAEGFYHLGGENMWWKAYIPAVLLMLGLAGMVLWRAQDYTSLYSMVLDLCCMAVFFIMIYLYQTKQNELRPVFLLVAGLLHVGCLYYNSYCYMNVLPYQERDLEGYIRQMEPVLEQVKRTEENFYRLEKKFYNSNNDAMLFSVPGLSHFSSTEKEEKKEWMHRLGYTNCNNFWVYYDKGSTIAAESLLGVSYVLDKEKRRDTNYILYGQDDGIEIYYNPYALSIGFLAGSIENIQEENVFDFQNQLYRQATGDTGDILKMIELTQNQSDIANKGDQANSQMQDQSDSQVKRDADSQSNSQMKRDAGSISGRGADTSYYEIIMEQEGPLYGYFTNGMDIQIYVNGKFVKDHLNSYGNGIVPLGYFGAGDKVQVEIQGACDSMFARQDMDVFQKQIDKLKHQSLYVYTHEEDHIEGEIHCETDSSYLVFSIPYEEEWKVKIDHKNVSTVKAYGGLLAVQVEEGTHAVTLQYETTGFSYSLWVSLGSIGIYLLMMAVWVWKKQRSRSYEISSI